MERLKKFLLALIGEKKYLRLLAAGFQRIYSAGLAGIDYQDIYFLKEFIEQGDCCVDIGAHLGYYTLELSRLVGPSGKVFAVEPMTAFHQTLKNLLDKSNVGNVTLYQLALGGEGEYVDMGIPRLGRMKKFAYARIKQSHSGLEYVESEKVKNESGDNLFKALSRLDFIKCDVEGLEVSVFSSLLGTLSQHHPVLLCELAAKADRVKLYEMIMSLGYSCFLLRNKKLRLLDVYGDQTAISHNHYFIPAGRMAEFKHLVST